MNKTVKSKWVKALRSGRYRQTYGLLFDDGAYCCLGVLCRVVGAKRTSDGFFAWRDSKTGIENEDWAELPRTLRKKFGITLEEQDALSYFNDVERQPFEKIADYIELNL